MRAACCRRFPCRELHAAEELQLNSLNRQMFVLGCGAENQPALFPPLGAHFSCHLYIISCEQSASPVSSLGTWATAGPVSASNGLRISELEKSKSLSSFFKVACNMINSFLYSSLRSSMSLELSQTVELLHVSRLKGEEAEIFSIF